jgi:hypothetical protein
MLKIFTLGAVASLIIVSMMPGIAAPKNTPGHMMQRSGSVPGHPGASGYAPGHVKKLHRVRSARNFAPGHRVSHHRHHHHAHHHVHRRVHHRTQAAR